MQKIRRNIPNAITCGNLFCGCLALVKAFEDDLVWTAYLVGIALVLDFFDGFTARMLKVSSAIGKDLDSLADMVTFGVVPGVVVFKLILLQKITHDALVFDTSAVASSVFYPAYLAFLIPVLSAIRLAKFNNDARQAESFIGLPTPANAVFFCSLPLVLKQITEWYISGKNPFETLAAVSGNPVLALLNDPWILIALTLIFSFLLVAELPLFSLKFKSFGWKGNEVRFVFLGMAALLLAFLQFTGIPLVIVLYILVSIVNNLILRRNHE